LLNKYLDKKSTGLGSEVINNLPVAIKTENDSSSGGSCESSSPVICSIYNKYHVKGAINYSMMSLKFFNISEIRIPNAQKQNWNRHPFLIIKQASVCGCAIQKGSKKGGSKWKKMI